MTSRGWIDYLPADRALLDRISMPPRPGEGLAPDEWTRLLRLAGPERSRVLYLGAKQLIYIWVTEGDDRVCEECQEMEGAAVLDPNEWTVSPGQMHPYCRCITQVIYADPVEAGIVTDRGFVKPEYRPPRRNSWRENVADHRRNIPIDAALYDDPVGWIDNPALYPLLILRLLKA